MHEKQNNPNEWKPNKELLLLLCKLKPTPSRILSPAIFYYYTDNIPATICISTLNYGWCVSSQISLHENDQIKKRLNIQFYKNI
jgi:hypothetical protein